MKLSEPISLSLIQTFRGDVDLYYWKGIPVARAWPKKPENPQTPAQEATRQAMRDMFDWQKANPLTWSQQWDKMDPPPHCTIQDFIRSNGLTYAYAGALTPAPDVWNLSWNPDPPPGTSMLLITIKLFDGFDPFKVTWMSQLNLIPPVKIQWDYLRSRTNRQGVPEKVYAPNLSRYYLPPSIEYLNLVPGYELSWNTETLRAAVYPVPLAKPSTPNMLGPIYSI